MPYERTIAGAVCLLFFVAIYATLGLRSANLSHGDVATDERAIVGAYAFRESGIRKLRFTEVEDGRAALGRPPKWYSRHPSGGVIFLAILLDLGLSPRTARFLPLLATTLGLYGLHQAVRRATGDARASLCALTLAATSSPIYLLADSLQLYSYAMLAKGWAWFFTVRVASSIGSERRWALVAAALNAFIGVLLFGLETMPAIGLFAFLYPLFAASGNGRRRAASAVLSASFTAFGMLAAWMLRLWNIAWTIGGGLGEAWKVVARAVVDRSVETIDAAKHERGYIEELAARLAIYVPFQVLAAALLLAAVLGLVVLLPRRTFLLQKSFFGLAAAALFADGAYFFVMRRHVAIHPHTTMHLAFGLAVVLSILAVSVVDFVSKRSVEFVLLSAVGVVVLYGALRPPIDAIPNLTTAAGREESARVTAEFGALSKTMPRGSVILLPTTPYSWRLRCLAAEEGFTAIDVRDECRGSNVAALFTAAGATARPIYAVVGRGSDPAFVAAIEERARSIGRGPRLKAFALSVHDAARLPRVDYRLTAAELTASRLARPHLEAPYVDGRGIRLFRAGGDGIVIHVPSAAEERETVFELPLSGAAARAERFAIEVWYKPAGARQPALRLAIEAVGPEGKATVCDEVLRPTSAAVVLDLPGAAAPTTLRLIFRLSLAPAAMFGSGARIAVRSVTTVLDG